MTKHCTICGRQYSEDSSFCHDDGNLLVREQPFGVYQPTQVVPTHAITSANAVASRWPTILIAVLLIAVGALAATLFYRSGGTEEGDKFETVGSRPTTPAMAVPATSKTMENAVSVPPVSATETVPGVSPAGRWLGEWTSPSGARLKFDLILNESGGRVNGQIDWKLLRTNRPDKISKVGSTAIEYVSGSYDTSTRQVTLRGYSKDDPNSMLVMLDQYRLNLSPSGRTLTGRARNGGAWNGRINLSK